LLPTASKLNAEFVQVASAIFQRYKFMLALAIQFGTFHIFNAVRQLSASNSALRLHANRK